jgi:aspartate 1-decarboxylase
MREYEQTHILDINNGNRLVTYILKGNLGSGVICLNGAAARLISSGDFVIIVSYAEYDDEELNSFKPVIILVDENNKVGKVI